MRLAGFWPIRDDFFRARRFFVARTPRFNDTQPNIRQKSPPFVDDGQFS
jgi:hypothetical protein